MNTCIFTFHKEPYLSKNYLKYLSFPKLLIFVSHHFDFGENLINYLDNVHKRIKYQKNKKRKTKTKQNKTKTKKHTITY